MFFNTILYIVCISVLFPSIQSNIFLSNLADSKQVLVKFNNDGFVDYISTSGIEGIDHHWVLQYHSEIFGIHNYLEDLQPLNYQNSKLGTSHIKYQQMHKGVPVFGRFITFHNNINGELSSITSNYLPRINFLNQSLQVQYKTLTIQKMVVLV